MTQPRRIRFVALDSWRDLSALLVAVHNAGYSSSAFLFVDFFFVLSGFVITQAYMTKLETRLDNTKNLLPLPCSRICLRTNEYDLH